MHKLEIKNLSIVTGGREGVKKASLKIGSGEVHILMGPNGSGKSSLVNALFGHPKYKISEGSIFLDGEDITALPPEKKAKKGLFLSLQYLPEISGVTLGNFLYRAHKEIVGGTEGVLEFHKRLTETAEKLGLNQQFISRSVNAGLSGGEKKQSEILQLAMLKPKFAFLDEIDSGVDVDSLVKIFRAIDTLKKDGTGFLLITHYPNILSRISPDRVYVMKEGAIEYEGGREVVEKIEKGGFGN